MLHTGQSLNAPHQAQTVVHQLRLNKLTVTTFIAQITCQFIHSVTVTWRQLNIYFRHVHSWNQNVSIIMVKPQTLQIVFQNYKNLKELLVSSWHLMPTHIGTAWQTHHNNKQAMLS